MDVEEEDLAPWMTISRIATLRRARLRPSIEERRSILIDQMAEDELSNLVAKELYSTS